jgi:hypothetical protein
LQECRDFTTREREVNSKRTNRAGKNEHLCKIKQLCINVWIPLHEETFLCQQRHNIKVEGAWAYSYNQGQRLVRLINAKVTNAIIQSDVIVMVR